MPAFVIRNHPAIASGEHCLPFGAKQDLVPRLVEIGLCHLGAIVTSGAEGGLVAQVRQVRSAQARCGPREAFEIDICSQMEMARVNSQDAFASTPVRKRNRDLPVEAARS